MFIRLNERLLMVLIFFFLYTGAIVPFQPQPLAQIPPAQAPPVLWDVGMDMLDYPEFYNAQRDGRLVVADAAFWNDLIDDNNQSRRGVPRHQHQPPRCGTHSRRIISSYTSNQLHSNRRCGSYPQWGTR